MGVLFLATDLGPRAEVPLKAGTESRGLRSLFQVTSLPEGAAGQCHSNHLSTSLSLHYRSAQASLEDRGSRNLRKNPHWRFFRRQWGSFFLATDHGPRAKVPLKAGTESRGLRSLFQVTSLPEGAAGQCHSNSLSTSLSLH